LDSLEFARGSANSTWGSVRAKMGHPKPFPVKYVAIGNEDCERKFYRGKMTGTFLGDISGAHGRLVHMVHILNHHHSF
jgi:alpha-L-arabinofuranosidase